MNKNLSTLCYSLFVAVPMLAGFTACSDDDEPVILAGIHTNATTFDLDQAGSATIEFTVEPTDAEVSDVNVTLDSEQSITASGLTRAGEGVWRINVQVGDIKNFGASQHGTLAANQTSGTSAQTSFVLADLLSVPEGAFTAHYPYTVNYCDAATHTAMQLPIILSGEGANVGDIADAKLLVTTTAPNLSGSDFVFGKAATGEYGLFMNQKIVDDVVAKNPQQHFAVSAHLELTLNNGRVTTIPLHFMFAAPQATFQDEKLTFNTADIANAGYTVQLTLDDMKTWRHIGFYDGPDKAFSETVNFSDYGFYHADGTRVDDGKFFSAIPTLDTDDNITISGDAAYVYAPGTYYYVYHVKSDWKYNGKTYERIRADFRYKVIFK